MVAFVNGRQYGGGAILAPGSRLDDGLLSIIVIEDAPWFELTWNAIRLFTGSIEGYRRYRHIASATGLLISAAPAPFHRDGEPEEPTARMEVSLQPRALRILVPRATADDPRGPFSPVPAL